MKKIEEIEEKIKEERLIEATKKGFYGQNGKIIFVVKILGEPIISQNEGDLYSNSTYLEDPYDLGNDLEESSTKEELMQNLPAMGMVDNNRPEGPEWSSLKEGENASITKIGNHFCGLSRGMHLEIMYNEINTELYLTYKGYQVYKEIKGDLLCYVPNDEWESHIDKLYKISKEKARKTKEQEFQKEIKSSDRQKQSWLNEMKKKWGFSL